MIKRLKVGDALITTYWMKRNGITDTMIHIPVVIGVIIHLMTNGSEKVGIECYPLPGLKSQSTIRVLTLVEHMLLVTCKDHMLVLMQDKLTQELCVSINGIGQNAIGVKKSKFAIVEVTIYTIFQKHLGVIKHCML